MIHVSLLTIIIKGKTMEISGASMKIAEFFYYLSGPFIILLLLVAILQLRTGVNQLLLTRSEIAIRFKRESILLSLDLCEKGIKKINLSHKKYHEIISKNKYNHYQRKLNTFDKSSFDKNCAWLDSFFNDDNVMIHDAAVDVLNELEVFAHYALSGVLDEPFAYNAEGDIYISIMKDMKPCIAAIRDSHDSSNLAKSIKLYGMWEKKKEKESLEDKLSTIGEIKQTKMLGDHI